MSVLAYQYVSVYASSKECHLFFERYMFTYRHLFSRATHFHHVFVKKKNK